MIREVISGFACNRSLAVAARKRAVDSQQGTEPRASASGLSAHFAITSRVWSGRRATERGANLIEFALVALLLCLLLLVFVDFGRMLLVYNSVNNSARAGVRYAIVHGATRVGGSGADGPSGPGNNPPEVVNVVKNFASSAPLNRTSLTVKVTYTPMGGVGNSIGDLVEVTVTYPYDPLVGYFPLKFTLSGRSQGRIAF